MRMDEDSEYREGVVLDRPSKPGKGSFVNCGMRKVRLWVKQLILLLADLKQALWVQALLGF